MCKAMVCKVFDIRQLRTKVPEIEETNKESSTIVPLTALRVFSRHSREKGTLKCLELLDRGEAGESSGKSRCVEFVELSKRKKLCDQGLANYSLGTKSSPQPVFI